MAIESPAPRHYRPAWIYYTTQSSPLGTLTLAAGGSGLCGVYFPGHQPAPSRAGWQPGDGPRFSAAREWLHAYFAGEKPRKFPPLTWLGGTEFQRRVWSALRDIPPGETRTYAAIARAIGAPAAVRAVGAAIGRNPLSILVPCHRVVGSSGALTGFAGGVERKRWLLAHEGALAEEAALFPAA
jgi:methylated-DNA-[protein]-cysteine S-methyltransferase